MHALSPLSARLFLCMPLASSDQGVGVSCNRDSLLAHDTFLHAHCSALLLLGSLQVWIGFFSPGRDCISSQRLCWNRFSLGAAACLQGRSKLARFSRKDLGILIADILKDSKRRRQESHQNGEGFMKANGSGYFAKGLWRCRLLQTKKGTCLSNPWFWVDWSQGTTDCLFFNPWFELTGHKTLLLVCFSSWPYIQFYAGVIIVQRHGLLWDIFMYLSSTSCARFRSCPLLPGDQSGSLVPVDGFEVVEKSEGFRHGSDECSVANGKIPQTVITPADRPPLTTLPHMPGPNYPVPSTMKTHGGSKALRLELSHQPVDHDYDEVSKNGDIHDGLKKVRKTLLV